MEEVDMRHHWLAVTAAVIWAVSRSINALPPAQHGTPAEVWPAGLRLVLGGFGLTGLYVYAGAWCLAGILALAALPVRPFSARWLIPTAGMSIFAGLIYTTSYIESVHAGRANSTWATACGFATVTCLLYAYVFLSLHTTAGAAPYKGRRGRRGARS